MKRFEKMQKKGYRLSIDLLGEKTMHEREADIYEERYLQLIYKLGEKELGIEEQNISVKLSALDPRFDVLDSRGTSERVRTRLRRIVREAHKRQVFVNIDMEDFKSRDLTLRIIRKLLGEKEFESGIKIGLVLQAYLKDADQCLDSILEWARDLPEPITIRLVRGAYWDSEVMQALAQHWLIPVFTTKGDCDVMFESLTQRILEEVPRVKLAVATHNVRSIAYTLALAEEMKIPKSDLEFQLLYGMGASLMKAIKEQGYAPRIYMPIGDPVIGMAYLVRRLLENVSSQSFVRQGIHSDNQKNGLLQAPVKDSGDDSRYKHVNPWGATPLLQFYDKGVKEKVQAAIQAIPQLFSQKIKPVIAGKTFKTSYVCNSLSPIDGRTCLGEVQMADVKLATQAIDTAALAFAKWKTVPVKERADCLRRAAKWLLENRFELMAWHIYEVGKTWREADGDIVEAADFLNFYAHEAEKLFHLKSTDRLYQEKNQIQVRPRGVCAVIAPWNFPTAILTGMTAAALVTGNTVIMKPAEQAMVCGWHVFQALLKGGIPPEVLGFLPGNGEHVGPVLIEDPRVNVIAFTGSKDVGLKIVEQANRRVDGQKHIKKVIVEMGGKNAVIVDMSADFDEAIPDVLYSAFGFAGQKCSALSRLIVLEEIYEDFLERLVQAASVYTLGNPLASDTMCGPVIDDEAYQKCQGFMAMARGEGNIVYEGKVPDDLKGYFIPPMIVTDLPENSKLLSDEIFGPLLCVLKAKHMQDAMHQFHQTDFALTGGLFSRTPSHIEQAQQTLRVGNLYINRAITGALVGRQPFGGFQLSGGGTKAGGRDYLREFIYQQTISENISRHGFAPLD